MALQSNPNDVGFPFVGEVGFATFATFVGEPPVDNDNDDNDDDGDEEDDDDDEDEDDDEDDDDDDDDDAPAFFCVSS